MFLPGFRDPAPAKDLQTACSKPTRDPNPNLPARGVGSYDFEFEL